MIRLRAERPGFRFPARAVKEFFFSTSRPDRLWIPTSLLYNGNRGLFSREKSDWGVKLTTLLHLVPRLRMRGAIPPLPNTFSWRGI